MRRRQAEQGYSLIELLVVVGMIGILSIVSVPAFMQYRQSARIKTSMTQMTSELRSARQRAITKNRPVKFSIKTTDLSAPYQLFDGNLAGTVWTPLGKQKTLDPAIWIESSTFLDKDSPTDGFRDIVFLPDGTLAAGDLGDAPTEDEGAKKVTKVVIRIQETKIAFNQYSVYFQNNGTINVVGSKY